MTQPWQQAEVLDRLYHGEGLSQEKIADELGCSPATVHTWMKKHDIELRDVRNDPDTDYPWQDKDTLEELYYGRQMKLQDMAEELDCGISTILKWMDRHGLERRDLAEARAISQDYGKTLDYYTLQQGYECVQAHHRGEKDFVYIHRLLAVAEFGFDAVADQQVHHTNHIPWDNRPDNIELMGVSEHKTHHLHVEHGHKPMPDP